MIKKDTDGFTSLVYLIGQHGAYRPPTDISYAMALAINRMGGWSHVCTWRYRDYPKMQPLFSEVFKDVCRLLSNPSASTLDPVNLGGLHETVQISPMT